MGKIISVDFEGVEASGGSKKIRIPEGDYGLEIKKVEQLKAKESKQPYLKIALQPIKGNPAGLKKGTINHNCSLQQQSLWNLRNLMEACGKTVPSKAIKIDLDKMVGWQCGGTVIDGEEYNGKVGSEITAFFPMEDLAPYQAANGSSKKKKKDEDEEEPEEEESEEPGEEEEIFG